MVKELKITFLIITVLVVSALAVLVYQKRSIQQKTPKGSSVEQIQRTLLNKSKISFPDIQFEFAAREIPKDVAYFVPAGTKGKITKAVVYKGGKKGYIVEFTADMSLEKTFPYYLYLTRPDFGWQLISAARFTTVQVIMDAKNSTYSVRTTQTHVDERHTNVTIQAIEN